MKGLSVLTLCAAPAMLACRWVGSRDGDHPPKLVSCMDAHTGGSGKRTQEYVSLRYRVNRFGGVDAETIRNTGRAGRNVASGWAESAAITTAASCTYEPAVRNGQAVDEVVQRTFLMEVGDVGATKFP